jgi:hypothetical protein
MYDGEKAAFAARTAESEGMEFFNGRESSRKRTMTYNIVMLLGHISSAGDGDASMPGGTFVILPLLAELTEAASVILGT